MPLPMVHLSVTLEVIEQLGKPITNAVLTGSLAPDAIHMRLESNRQDKNLTHIKHREFDSLDEALECLKKHYDIGHTFDQLTDLDASFLEGQKGFDLGYFIHCVTDYLWYYHVYIQFKASFLTSDTPAYIKQIYYQESEYLDFWIYSRVAWRERVFHMLSTFKNKFSNEYVSIEEVERWNEHILHLFDNKTSDDYTTVSKITTQQVETFIVEASDIIIGLLRDQKELLEP